MAVAQRVDDQRNRWFLEPVLRGNYPGDLLEEYVQPDGRRLLKPEISS